MARARPRRRREGRRITSLALVWKVGAILPITVLGTAMLVNGDGGASDPARPGPQVSEQAVEPLPDDAAPSPTRLRRAVQAVTPPPGPVTPAEEVGDAVDAVDVGADAGEGPAAPASSGERPNTPEPSPKKQRPPADPSPTPTPDEARQQCMEQGALDPAACIEDLVG